MFMEILATPVAVSNASVVEFGVQERKGAIHSVTVIDRNELSVKDSTVVSEKCNNERVESSKNIANSNIYKVAKT